MIAHINDCTTHVKQMAERYPFYSMSMWLTCWKVAWTRLAGNMLLRERMTGTINGLVYQVKVIFKRSWKLPVKGKFFPLNCKIWAAHSKWYGCFCLCSAKLFYSAKIKGLNCHNGGHYSKMNVQNISVSKINAKRYHEWLTVNMSLFKWTLVNLCLYKMTSDKETNDIRQRNKRHCWP